MDRRPVERQNRGDDAVGFIDDPGLDRALIKDLAVQGVGQTRVVVKPGVAEGQVEPQRIAAWLADLTRLQVGQFLKMLSDLDRDQPHQPAALAGGQHAPLRECPA